MKFIIYRTSDELMNKKDKKEYEEFTFFKTFSEDDIPVDIYYVEINQLEDLKKVFNEYGRIIIRFDLLGDFENYVDGNDMIELERNFDGCIEIYDSYRE